MKKLALFLAAFTATAFTTQPAYSAEGDVVLNKIVAVVNNGVVLASEVAAETQYLKLQARSSGQALPADEVFEERVISRLIDQEVQRQHANKLGISIDPGSVNRAIEQIAANNNMDTRQLRDSMQKEGFDFNRFRINVEQELLFSRLLQRDVQSRIKVSAQEIDDHIELSNSAENQRYQIQHILLAVSATANASEYDKALARAESILAKLRDGADFSRTAVANSDGARALEGGDLGWRSLQEIPDFLATALVTMNVGDVSEPLRSANGLHIVRLNNKRSGTQTEQQETLVRHIFLANNPESDPANEIINVRERIKSGESFAALAKELSQDPNSASKGGELPWFTDGQMPAELEQAAAALSKGALSQPFKTQYGWHVLEVLDTRTGAVNNDVLRRQAEQVIRQRKAEQETDRWIRQLRDESFIEMRT